MTEAPNFSSFIPLILLISIITIAVYSLRKPENKTSTTNTVENYIEIHSKSQIVGFLLTLILGPLGLLYSSWVSALILITIPIASSYTILDSKTSVLGLLFICWILSVLLSFLTVSKYNKKVKATAELYSK